MTDDNFIAPRTAPLPPETSRAQEELELPYRSRELPLPPSPKTAGADGRERHIDVCDYCKKIHRRARSRSRSRYRSSHRCRHRRQASRDADARRRQAQYINTDMSDSSDDGEDIACATARAQGSAAAPRNLLPSSRNASGTATPREGSSLPPYVSNPPSESGARQERGRPIPSRSRSSTLGAASVPRIPKSTMSFVRDQQHRQLAQQRRQAAAKAVPDPAGQDLGEVLLARVPQAADPLRVHFVPSHASASATAGSSDPRHRLQSFEKTRHDSKAEYDCRNAHDSTQSIVAQMQLHERDERLSTLLDDCVRDPQQSSSSAIDRRVQSSRESHLKKRHRKPSSLIDSVLGFDEVNPQDLIYGEGSKVDGGFAYAMPSRYREGSILLDAETQPLPDEPGAGESTMTSATPSGFASTVTSYFKRSNSSQDERARSGRHQAAAAANTHVRDSTDSTISSLFAFRRSGARPTSLSDRVNRSNLRPRQLDLSPDKPDRPRGPSKLRESTLARHEEEQDSGWEDVQLKARPSTGKNARLAEAIGVDRPATAKGRFELERERRSRDFDQGAYDDEKNRIARDERVKSGGTDPASLARRKTRDSYLRDSNASMPNGMSEADIVAICLVQGMVPPGLPRDANLVTWSGPLSPTNPRNWPAFHKWYACIFVALATFLANAGTNMVAPALGLISDSYEEIYIPSYRGFLIGSYVFAFAFAPLLYGPLSELLGRKPVLVFGTTLFWVANLLSAFVDASWELMILRFLAALGASAPMAIGGAVLTDIFSPNQRGRAMTVFALAPQLGPVLGPIMGGWVSQETRDWRLIFWVAAGSGFFVAFFILFMRESYTPRILACRAKGLRKQTGNKQLSTIFERRQETVRQVLTRGMIRPIVLFCCEPIVQLLCLYVSLIYGIMHLVTATFPAVFGTIYSEYPGWASMHFIGIGVGTIAGGIIGGHLIERNYRRLALRNKGVGKPEYKIYSFLYSVWLPPLGLLLYGLVTYYGVHWIFADAGIVLFCLGISMAIVAIQSYIVDCYALLAGSALTSTIVIRSIVGTGATIAAEDVLLEGGMLWSNVALATACVVIGVPVAYTIYFCGARLRQRSRHATHKR